METTEPASLMVSAIRAVINEFISERLQAKLDKIKEDQHEEREKLQQAYAVEVWLADAARRVQQIQQVTHAIKYTHPDARGSSVFSRGNNHVSPTLVGTHVLGEKLPPDVVGNAAALDVYKFLRLEVGGKALLELALTRHEALREALSKDSSKADEWINSFAGLVEAKGKPASHTLAKQLFWPMAEGQYHLLAPLFPSSLVTTVWSTVREHRFSEAAKEARNARKTKEAWPHGYHEYPNVVVQQFGGTKPQNISQLNSERYGENYLLPSLPPSWQSAAVRPPLLNDSVFSGGFARRRATLRALNELRAYLRRVKDLNNLAVRQGRAQRMQVLTDELLQYAAEIGSLEPGWSASDECRLNPEEQCWLDPYRAETDENFAAMCQQGAWQEAVCRRFANWLNARLIEGANGLSMGEDEAFEWQQLLSKELDFLHRELPQYG